MQNSNLDFRDREALFKTASSETFDVLIIGGGITGAGVARDAAMRGLSVALVEARDFASGTSSRSSKMVHGGLRYLAQGHVNLVREAASERANLRRIAPHLAQVEPFVLPYRSLAASAKLKAGLVMFEKLGNVAKSERHYGWSKADLEKQVPMLNTDGMSGAFVYHECLTDDARLTLANIRSAKSYGAVILSYAAVTKILSENGEATGVVVKGRLPDETLQTVIKARQIVNAAGPWVDSIMELEDGEHMPALQLTRGIHLVLDHDRLPIHHTIIMPASDKRSVFAVPRDGFTYIGTSDTFYTSADYWPDIDRESVDYLLEACGRAFTIAPLGYDDIQNIWSGVRPLIAQPGKSPSEISREDEVWTGKLGILSIAGGKLSAYRRMAERIVNLVQERMGHQPKSAPTDEAPLPGGSVSMDTLNGDARLSTFSEDARTRLTRLYGDEVFAVLEAGGDMAAEIARAVSHEGALRLEDYWGRRSARAWFSKQGGMPELHAAGDIMAGLLGWSDARKTQEIDNCQKLNDAATASLTKLAG